MLTTRTLIAALMLFAARSAIAEEAARPVSVPPAVSTGSLLQISLSLLLVLAAIIAVAWLLRRMNLAQAGTGNLLKVIGTVAIGQRERVTLIEVGETWLVVGVGPGQIRTLHTLSKIEGLEATTQPGTLPDNKFARLLSSLVKRPASDRKTDAS
ncbi:MAG: flagellar biosynthetic protein FliO [Gallionellales bacterium RIFOXYB12_FULL_54_9]|nr:MAG: flagellar biosynthetic protein FliO [Gallionellales bacterium RIFOXYB12_FULL_54_9]